MTGPTLAGPGWRAVRATGPDGVALAADVSGALDRTPVVLLAGQSLGPETHAELASALAAALPVVVLHTRGTGRSGDRDGGTGDGGAGDGGAGDGAWTTTTFAGDVVTVLDALGLDRVHVHGFSMGGRVAQTLAAHHPDRVARLVLGATGPGGTREVPRDPDVDRVLRRSHRPEGRRALAELFFRPAWVDAHPDVAARFAPQPAPRVQRLHHAASLTHDAGALLPSVSAPTLVLTGDEDRLTPAANAHVLAGLLPDARVLELPGARHGYLASHLAATTAAVVAHLLG